ncbi:hypothetical protein JMJ77_0014190 [Colletotrichum scovillei]|uniref:Uncharacterized protein n=1 Tax=Colletotrichum scovillei TaxID=1209932 RepID=A0A9P7R4W0_9PEZI|nr:hypothetical protein JMJ77_0014190 [Colletotrichum scovillei]KAG7065715.1 hypothetical protein JMJ78_0012462 [Colletotrichum scovillei]KAG7068317.1 hypothetical protein JMJ76_0008007 [Colletotrichum scovillei]
MDSAKRFTASAARRSMSSWRPKKVWPQNARTFLREKKGREGEKKEETALAKLSSNVAGQIIRQHGAAKIRSR